jgi:hypothetical protein
MINQEVSEQAVGREIEKKAMTKARPTKPVGLWIHLLPWSALQTVGK